MNSSNEINTTDNFDMNHSSLDVRIWGPEAWNFMHAITFAYPTESPSAEDKENISQFFKYMGLNLPCTRCRFHFDKMLEKTPVDTTDRASLSKWLVDRHNDVNTRLGKPTFPYEFVKKKYEHMGNICPTTEKKNCACPPPEVTIKKWNPLQNAIIWCLVIFIFLLLLAIAIFVVSKKKKRIEAQ